MNKIKLIFLVIVCFVLIFLGVIGNLDGFQKSHSKSAEISKKEEIPIQEPKLELIQDEINIERGTAVDLIDYISIAEDEYGYNMKYEVECPKINTDVTGKYQIMYTLKLKDEKEIKKTLILNIH